MCCAERQVKGEKEEFSVGWPTRFNKCKASQAIGIQSFCDAFKVSSIWEAKHPHCGIVAS